MPLSTTVHFSLATRLPIKPGERRCLLAIEIRFQSVADGFVQQNARPSRAEDDFHFARGSLAGVELQDRLPSGFLREIFGSLLAEEEVEGHASAAAGAAASGVALGLGDAGNIHAGQRLGIFGKRSIRADHQDVTEFIGIAGANFLDSRIVGASSFVGAHHQFHFGADLGINRGQRHGIKTAGGAF